MRNVDRRFATCVSNIFKLKNLQILQVKDVATTALRKTSNNSYTAGQLKSSKNINNLLQNDEGSHFLNHSGHHRHVIKANKKNYLQCYASWVNKLFS